MTAQSPAPRRRRGPTIARWLLFAVILAGVAYSLAGQWAAVRHDLGRVAPGWIVGAGAASVVAVALPVMAWRAALRATGSVLPLRQSSRVFFVGQLGKYVPGSVWPLLAQMELGRRYGLARQQVAVGGLLQLALSVLVAGALGLLALPLAGSLPAWEVTLVVAAVVLGAVLLAPPVLQQVLTRVLALLRRPPLAAPIGRRATGASIGWSVGASVAIAAQADLLARGLGADTAGTFLAGGALLLGVALGVLVIPVPAGAGIREATVVLLLHGHLGTAEATALALLSRLLLAFADLVMAGVGTVLGLAGRQDAAPSPDAPVAAGAVHR